MAQETDKETEQRADTLARNRYFFLSFLRLGGALSVLVGFVLIAERYAILADILGEKSDKILGVALVLVGLLGFAIVPRALARRWKDTRKP